MTEITRGSGNVFADIGVPDAKTHLIKAELVRRIAREQAALYIDLESEIDRGRLDEAQPYLAEHADKLVAMPSGPRNGH